MRLKSIVRVSLAAAMAVAFAVSADQPVPEVGSAAPPLELKAADGNIRSLAASDGPKVLIFYRGLW